ncbi:hypothetical protein [Paenibacillus sp. J22TS3]|uniref:hypothetical protein n=1 Tax=Paenibacillus sp. J22TS3 TaxID=2807192 RepID=UPI001B0757D7|nr:hypothetical protein [Paenibacillus sp. J22TS3]GIP24691.1 hypothetical protein J22TS3_49660 [Paenibacillus sp. J22TS3]
MSAILKVTGYLILVAGFIFGITRGEFLLTLITWFSMFTSGIIFISLGMILDRLAENKAKLNTILDRLDYDPSLNSIGYSKSSLSSLAGYTMNSKGE